MKYTFLFALISIFSACSSPVENIEQETKAILEASKAFSQAYMDKDLEKQMTYYTDDIVNIPGNRPMLIGKEAVANYWRQSGNAKVIAHKSTPSELEIIGNMAKDYGYYEGRSVRDGDTTSFRGHYLITWKKGDDGQWRMSADMWAGLND
ncbi:YybH family protein [Roseivirga echinicomitans]|uniref:DUF4440 domain-containing protein n=1 Tax=Roseivirga echinicomitans TaxID=296218 RepID=A0A150XUL3_9BACT|nr:nuclear transport factor 2 family protein [Roseivirga echinicomitans]KYG82431.1 hypothetical protein AWN68_14310 [Roseivirga echinicomitans]